MAFVTRYHWQTSAIDTLIAGNGSSTNSDHPIPLNATLKRVVIRGCAVEGQLFTTDPTLIVGPVMSYDINYISPDYGFSPPRLLYRTTLAIPKIATAIFDTTSNPGNNRIYSAFYAAGDHELGLNFKTNYGGPGKSASTLRFTWRLARPRLGQNLGNYGLTLQFCSLYYL